MHLRHLLLFHGVQNSVVALMDFEIQGAEQGNGRGQDENEFYDHWLYPAIVAADPPHCVASFAV